MIPPDGHEVLIRLEGGEAVVETNPEGYVPEFLAYDEKNIFYLDRKISPLDDYANPEIMAITKDAIYLSMKRKPEARFPPEMTANLIEGMSCFPRFSLLHYMEFASIFVGENEWELEQAKIEDYRQVELPIDGLNIKFKASDMEGSLLIPENPLSFKPRAKITGEFKRDLWPVHIKPAINE